LATCEKDSQCPTGLVCGTVTVEGKSTKGCVPPVGAVCQRATDCALPNVCQANQQATALLLTCQANTGGAIGAECNPANFPGTCASHLCSPTTSTCVAPCVVDADCALGSCRQITPLPNYTTQACDVACAKDGDCRGTQVCQFFRRVNNSIQTQCAIAAPSDKAEGASCNPNQFTKECASNFCSISTSTCAKPCTADTDCASGKICELAYVQVALNTYREGQVCMPAAGTCAVPSDCRGTLCGVKDRNGSSLLACISADPQLLPTNGTCDAMKPFPGDCQTGLCDSESGTCTTPCKQDSDCTLGVRTSCGTLTVNGNSFKACVKPPVQP
jgi:hypothetical protein